MQLHIKQAPLFNATDNHVAFEINSPDIAIAFLKTRNIDIIDQSDTIEKKRCFFRDPFGNRFELIENI